MSIQPTFTCVDCEYGRLPFDPQESAGTCPSCGRVYLAQAARLSKSDLRLELFYADLGTAVPGVAIDFPAPDRDEMLAQRAEKQEAELFEESAEDLVEMVERAAESDPKLRAEIEGEDEPPKKKFGKWPFG